MPPRKRGRAAKAASKATAPERLNSKPEKLPKALCEVAMQAWKHLQAIADQVDEELAKEIRISQAYFDECCNNYDEKEIEFKSNLTDEQLGMTIDELVVALEDQCPKKPARGQRMAGLSAGAGPTPFTGMRTTRAQCRQRAQGGKTPAAVRPSGRSVSAQVGMTPAVKTAAAVGVSHVAYYVMVLEDGREQAMTQAELTCLQRMAHSPSQRDRLDKIIEELPGNEGLSA